MAQHLYGIHDFDPAWAQRVQAAGCTAWCVTTHALAHEDRYDFGPLAQYGITPIARLNWGYGADGTLPIVSGYAAFAQRVAGFVRASPGCRRWIIGNEPNHCQERPAGVPIQPQEYVEAYRLCRRAIHQLPGHEHDEVITAAIAPWNIETGDWLDYFRRILEPLGPLGCDGIALHTYTHGPNPSLIPSEYHMSAPFLDRRADFRAYRDFLAQVPAAMRGLPAYITETDPISPWRDANEGWVECAYAEIDTWNRQVSDRAGSQKIHCLCLYRWSRDDQWCLQDKPQLWADFEDALAHGFPVPSGQPATPTANEHEVFLPVITDGPTPPPWPQAPAFEWDPRLTAREVKLLQTAVRPGERYWRLAKAYWLDEQEADRVGPDRHILIDVRDEQGQRVVGVPVRFTWSTGEHTTLTEAKPGEPFSANYPMTTGKNAFSVEIADGSPSDKVVGIGMGAETPEGWNADIHTSTVCIFQRAVAATPAQPDQPGVSEPTPVAQRPAVVTALLLNVRSGPGEQWPVVDRLSQGSRVVVNSEATAGEAVWYRIGAQRWVHGDWLDFNAEPAEPSPDSPEGGSPKAPWLTQRATAGQRAWLVHLLARVTGVEPAMALAVLQVESGADGFDASGRLLIRFEVHEFVRLFATPRVSARFFRFDDATPWTGHTWRPSDKEEWRPLHQGATRQAQQDGEWAAYRFAATLDAAAAAQACGLGAAQIMGSNFRRIGYASPQAMFADFAASDLNQIAGLFAYCQQTDGLVAAMQCGDFSTIAAKYNGPGNVATYAPLIRAQYEVWTEKLKAEA